MTSTEVNSIESLSADRIQQLQSRPGEDLIRWAYETYGDRAAIGTSLQATGMVQIDLASRHRDRFRVFTVDTLRLHDRTYEFHKTVQDHYGIDLEVHTPDSDQVQSMVERHGEFLFFDGRDQQQLCCEIRKQRPHDRALGDVDVWICGLRRDQSENRHQVPRVEVVTPDGQPILKLAPLADWTRDEVWDYIHENNVPYNPLYDEGYETISCRICTTPVQEGEDRRAGRWRWFKEHNRECGLHFDDGGGI